MAPKIEKYFSFGIKKLFSLFEPSLAPKAAAASELPGSPQQVLRSLERRRPLSLIDPLAATLPSSIFEDGTVERRNFPQLEHGKMAKVNALVLHQSASPSAENTLMAYQSQPMGSHFLIGRNGKIYQTAALDQVTWHVGKIRPRNREVNTCSEAEYGQKGPVVQNPSATHRKEAAKNYPDRFPTNNDSIGIEIIGKYDEKRKAFEAPTEDQLQGLKKLLEELKSRYQLSDDDIYRHGSISYKKVGEGCGLGYD